MVKIHTNGRRGVLKLMAVGSGAVLGGSAISGVAAADSRELKRPLIDDLNVKNNDEVERSFEVTIYNTSGSADQAVFSERVTAEVRERVSFKNVFPRGKNSRIEVRLDDGRTASETGTIVGKHPNRYGMEVRATADWVDAYPQHVDPGPADFVGGGD